MGVSVHPSALHFLSLNLVLMDSKLDFEFDLIGRDLSTLCCDYDIPVGSMPCICLLRRVSGLCAHKV